MAQVSDLPQRTVIDGDDILYLVDPVGGMDYKTSITELALQSTELGTIISAGTAVIGAGGADVPRAVTTYGDSQVVGQDLSVDAGAGTVTVLTAGYYQLTFLLSTDYAVNNQSADIYVLLGGTLSETLHVAGAATRSGLGFAASGAFSGNMPAGATAQLAFSNTDGTGVLVTNATLTMKREL